MRKKYAFPLALLGLLGIFQSCTKQSQTEIAVTPPATQVINATAASDIGYELVLDKTENVKISRQASHFLLSETRVDAKSGLYVYKYVPEAGYTGIDEVVLSSVKTAVANTSNFCNTGDNNNSINNVSYFNKLITVKINVTR